MTDDLVHAAVAAALREAAEAVEDYCSDAPDLSGHGHSVGIRDYILALIPDGGAALDRVVAKHIGDVNEMVADRIEELEAKLAKIKASFRRNMMQAHPGYTHEQFDRDFDEMMKGQDQ
jgi:hypothetical protein